MKISIVSLNVGYPTTISHKDKAVITGIFKKPMDRPVYLSKTNFEGDGQADLVHHGGVEKAVCVYPYEHYPFWEQKLGMKLEVGAFGENLTIQGLLEEDVCIGDKYQLGEAIVEVSQPRQPCYKLSVKYNNPELPLLFQNTGFTGYYFRVLQEGEVSINSTLKRIEKHEMGITISYANKVMHHHLDHLAGVQKMLSVSKLSESWRKTFLKRLEGLDVDIEPRLKGNLGE
ncbi:MAG TPA: MOSC domain-containing protein [Bacillota bacterium]|nr:MOSC domain-containing protein [Bacillota bacterium]